MAITPDIYSFMTSNYANTIYCQGTQRFTARDGYSGIPLEYHEPVKQYAALNFYASVIEGALTKTWLLNNEYADTMAYMVALYGRNRLTKRDGFDGVRAGFYSTIEQSIARLLTESQINTAFANGWLSQQEYDEVMSYVI